MVDPAAADDLVLAFLCGDEFEAFAIGMNDEPGMGIECHHDGLSPNLMCFIGHDLEDLLVPDVDTVERPDSDYRVWHRLKQINTVVYLHKNNLITT